MPLTDMPLFEHQKRIIEEDRKYTGLWLGTGSSKTRIALELAQGRILVICPKTLVEDGNWQRENKKWDINKNITVISKETFRRDWEKLPYFDTVICDEVHGLLGVTPNVRQRKKQVIPKASQLFEALDAFLEKHPPERLYLCTATIVKSPFSVWAAEKLLRKHDGSIGNFMAFRSTYYSHLPMPGREVWVPKKTTLAKEALAKRVHLIGYVGRLEDFVDMPEQTFKTEYLELTESQKKALKEIKLEFPDPLVGAMKQHQIENGCLVGNEFMADKQFDNQKIEKLLDYALEFPRMIVFAKYKAQIHQIEAAMRKAGKKVYILTGETKDRGAVILAAKEDTDYVFICQVQISSGWEAPDCPVMVFASLDFSLVNLIQAQGRISRINNPKRNLYIYLTVKGGIDEHVYQTVVENKMDFHLAQYEK